MSVNDAWRIKRDGQGAGGFMCPPGHPNHSYVLHGYWSRDGKAVNVGARNRGSGPDYIGSIEGALGGEAERNGVPQGVRDQVARIMARAELVCSDLWIRNVYGYFRNSYAPPDGNRNVSNAIFPGKDELPPPAERHLGYLCVREYFPEHTPRLDLIENPGKGYGSWPCERCGQTVQYEARADALCVFPTNSPDCPAGEPGTRHLVTP